MSLIRRGQSELFASASFVHTMEKIAKEMNTNNTLKGSRDSADLCIYQDIIRTWLNFPSEYKLTHSMNTVWHNGNCFVPSSDGQEGVVISSSK